MLSITIATFVGIVVAIIVFAVACMFSSNLINDDVARRVDERLKRKTPTATLLDRLSYYSFVAAADLAAAFSLIIIVFLIVIYVRAVLS